MIIARATRVILAAVLIAVCIPFAAQMRVAGAQEAPEEVIQIPIRWCALKGTTVATNPSAFGEPDTDSVLLRRLERASDHFWLPRANIVFRSAMTADVPPSKAHFPIIDDPVPPPTPSATDLPGDVRGFAEREAAATACKSAWDALPVPAGVGLYGPVAVAVQRILESDGTPTGSPGISMPPTIAKTDGTLSPCTDPLDIGAVTNGSLTVADPSTLPAGVDDAKSVAHELGHMLNLGDGNGVDDDPPGTGPYDRICDHSETNDPPTSLMNGSIPAAINHITARQREDARAVAAKIEGAFTLSSDLMLLPGCTVTPEAGVPGDFVTVKTAGFGRPGERVRFDLGDLPILDAELDASDNAVFEFSVPSEAAEIATPEVASPHEGPPWFRLLTVLLADSALTAHCLFEIVI